MLRRFCLLLWAGLIAKTCQIYSDSLVRRRTLSILESELDEVCTLWFSIHNGDLVCWRR
jgi:hypothetical protein